uniref:Ig-like domain-containing protein n=1 Tax=Lates calcarifer TaxID=8187 RepID=A0A4W6C053_LATCA
SQETSHLSGLEVFLKLRVFCLIYIFTDVKDLKISGNTAVRMGDALNLTCSVDSFPASDITWTKSGSDKILPAVQKHSGSVSLIIQDVTVNDFGQYNCTAKHLGNTLVEKGLINLILVVSASKWSHIFRLIRECFVRQALISCPTDVEKPVITGMTTVQEGDALHLTCSVDSSHPSDITWTKLGSNKNLQKETKVILHKDAGIASLFISNVTAEHSGQYICTAKHEIINVTVQSEVTVTCK